MLKIGFSVFVILTFLPILDVPRAGEQLDRFWRVYSQWALEHPEYECAVSPEIEIVHSRYRLWQIKQESGKLDGVLKVTADFPVSHEAYIFLTDDGQRMIYFPEINRTILFCLDRSLGSESETGSFDLSAFFLNLKLIKEFLIFEEFSETNEGFIYEMILDAEKMRGDGLLPKRTEVREARFIFTLKKSGELVRMSRQFDDGELEVLYFDYISFSSDEVRESFPKIEDRRSRNIMPDSTYTAALEEIKRVRQNSEALGEK